MNDKIIPSLSLNRLFKMGKDTTFSIYGGGSWGTALACHIASVTGKVNIYLRNEDTAKEINHSNHNSKYLGDTKLHKSVKATTNLEDLKGADVIVIAVPSYSFDGCVNDIKKLKCSPDTILLVATKGISSNPVELFSDKLKRELPNPFAFISGPNFAKELAIGMYTSATISSEDPRLASEVAGILKSDNFPTYVCHDIVTIQIAGIVKNIVAIKSGIMSAEGHKENARAWLVTMGLQEIAAISSSLGGKASTLLDPAVVGDLILTGYSTTSRNTKFGYEFCRNGYSKDFLVNYPTLVEGVEAAKLIKKLIDPKLSIPIISSVVELVS
jgi:glycerol-3-phosphate dehydrogenase (NAD(P)+)